jgi:hypothetical protein
MLETILTALETAKLSFAHHAWSHAPDGDYGVYAEDSGDDFMSDDIHAERGTNYWFHYFTRDDSSTPRTTIEAAFNAAKAPWYLNTVQYENDTGYIHYEWSVGILG